MIFIQSNLTLPKKLCLNSMLNQRSSTGIMSDTEEKCIYGPVLCMEIPDCSFAEFAFPWMKSQPEDHIIQVRSVVVLALFC